MDRHIQLLRPEVLAANARVIAMPIETRRARARAGDTARDDAGEDDVKDVLQADIEVLPDLAGMVTPVGELPDEIADWDTAI